MYQHMSTINLANGEQYPMYNMENDFARLLHDNLGLETEMVFREMIKDEKQTAKDLLDEIDELSDCLAESRENEDDATKKLDTLRDQLDKLKRQLDMMLDNSKLSRIVLADISRELGELQQWAK